MAKKRREPEDTYDVSVWDHEGNVVKVLWDATADEVDALYAEYEDDPLLTVVANPH